MPDYRQGRARGAKREGPKLDPNVRHWVQAVVPSRSYRDAGGNLVTRPESLNHKYTGKTYGFMFTEGVAIIPPLGKDADHIDWLERRDALYGLYNSGHYGGETYRFYLNEEMTELPPHLEHDAFQEFWNQEEGQTRPKPKAEPKAKEPSSAA